MLFWWLIYVWIAERYAEGKGKYTCSMAMAPSYGTALIGEFLCWEPVLTQF